MKILLLEGAKRSPRQIWERLESKGFPVTPLVDLAGCTDALKSDGDAAVLIDLDHNRSGLDSIKEIRAHVQDAIILMMASPEMVALLDRALAEGASDVILKYPDLSHLEEIPYALQRMLDRRDLKRQVQLFEQRSECLLLAMHECREGIFVVAEGANLVYTNISLLRRLEYDPGDDLTGQPMEKIVLPADGEFDWEETTEPFRARRWKGTARGKKKDGSEIPLQLSLTHYLDPRIAAEPLLVGICHTSSLEGPEEQNVIGEYIRHVTQDLKGPVAAMMGYLEIASSVSPEHSDPQQLLSIQRIEALARHLLDLITNHTSALEIEGGKFEIHKSPIPLHQVLALAVQDRKPEAESKNIELVLQADSGLLPVAVDAFQIERAVAILISNAISLSPANGNVTVSCLGNTQEVRIGVKDSGAGIRAEEIPQLFDRLKPLRRRGGDIDTVGLFVVRHIALAHGGRIEVQSDAMEGTTLTLCLPL